MNSIRPRSIRVRLAAATFKIGYFGLLLSASVSASSTGVSPGETNPSRLATSTFSQTFNLEGNLANPAPWAVATSDLPYNPMVWVTPLNQGVAHGEDATFVAEAHGVGTLVYKWYKNGNPIYGADSPSYTVRNAQDQDVALYRARISNSYGYIDTESAFLWFIDRPSPPVFFIHPKSQTGVQGLASVFYASVAGTPWPNLQWQKDGVDIPGATQPYLMVDHAVPADAGNYAMVATNRLGTVISSSAHLEITTSPAAPKFTKQPLSQAVKVGSDVSFDAAATGSPAPTYSWVKDDVPIPDELGTTLTLKNVQLSDSGKYRIYAHNMLGLELSDRVELTVLTTFAPVFTAHPATQNARPGQTVTFFVAVTGVPTPVLQWYRNGVPIPVSSSSFTMGVTAATANTVFYVTATNPLGTATSNQATLNVVTSVTPKIVNQPLSHILAAGSTGVLSVGVADQGATPESLHAGGATAASAGHSAGDYNYQWYKDGAPIAGATRDQLMMPAMQATQTGQYQAQVSNGDAVVASEPGVLKVISTNDPGRIVNLSVRTNAFQGDQALIMGFVLGGPKVGRPKEVLVRGIGPALANFGVASPLIDPTLQLFSGGQSIPMLVNDNWSGLPSLTTLGNLVGAFTLPDPTSRDAALATTLFPGPYSAIIQGKSQNSGTALAEIYDGAPLVSDDTSMRLVNVSARANISPDNPLIAGFVILGNTAKTVLIRGVGPSLAAFVGESAMTDPQLELYTRKSGSDEMLAANDNWNGSTVIASAADRVGAFALSSPETKDACLLITLDPGIYTAKVTGATGSTGVALVEVYEVP
ncbi:MAG: immunoglobulin domain-containing protein [Verrucomicrobia bacterium]|nr:immunoglobulin domain-containing protein [Verrucomicrobiota bacterium]